jgi:DNA modification methylase
MTIGRPKATPGSLPEAASGGLVQKDTIDLVPYINNAKIHEPMQVDMIAASIKEFGFNNPILLDGDNGVIAGHGRLEAAKKLNLDTVPCIELAHLSETQKKAYILADNRLGEIHTEWNMDLVTLELEGLTSEGFDIELTGFEIEEVEPEIVEDEAPEVQEDPITKLGDVWLLGEHRVMCGDSTILTDVERLMSGEKAQLMHADPPYGMGKEKDGVQNDNLYREKLDAFQMDWWAVFRTCLVDNASAYIWGNAPDLWRLWYKGGLADSERLTWRSQIIWDKPPSAGPCGAPQGSEKMRSFPHGYEVCLFFMLGEQGFNNNADNYWEGFEPIRLYLKSERDKLGWNNKFVAGLFGFHPSMADHWFSKSQWTFPQRGQYEAMQKTASGDAFKKDYDELKKDYDELKKEFYATRAYFDNTHENMTDVWNYGRVKGEERHGHATPKPVEMMGRIMKSSLPKDGLCIEPFGGSGSTLIAAEQTGRKCYTMELDPRYIDVIVKRWETLTGNDAILEGTDETFKGLSDDR